MKRLVASMDIAEIESLRSILELSGIHCEVRQEFLAQVFPSGPFAPELWVNEADYVDATHFLAEARKKQD